MADHGEVPLSKPGLVIFWPGLAQPPVPFTVSVNVVECEAEAAVPVMVTLYVPAGVDADVARVRLDDPPAVTDVGLKVAVAPVGSPDADRATDSAVPEVTAVLTMAVVDPPAVTVPEVGLTEIEKLFPPVLAQPGSVNEARRVFQLKVPLAGMYSWAYQKVQPSTGSTTIDE